MKKVVIFGSDVHEIPPTKGAAVQTWIDETAKRLIKYQPHIISIAHDFYPIKEFKDGVFFHRIRFSKIYKRIFQKILGWDIYSYNKRVFNIIKQIKPDIIHIHNYYGANEIVQLIRKFDSNIKVVLHMHNMNKKFENFEKVDVFIGCSDFITSYYKKFIQTERFETIYNGVDIDKYQNTMKYKNILKNDNFINVCYFGRISPEKGVDRFIEIAAKLKNNNKYKFYCFGEIAQRGERRKFYEKLLKYINKYNLTNIKFYDYISPYKMQMAYHYADYVIVPSKIEEAFGMVALEALAAQITVIGVKKGGLVEFLDNEIAYLIDENNFLDEVVEILLQNNYKNGLARAKKFDWSVITNKLERIYDEILY